MISLRHIRRVVALAPPVVPSIVALGFLVCAVRLALFVDRYAVNILFADQWDFLDGLFRGEGLWTLFRTQHGPERQGLGNLLNAVLFAATGWNSRADVAAQAVVMGLAGLAALWLVRRTCGAFRATDVVVPLVFLTTIDAETYVLAPNLAHGPLPVLLVVLVALALTIESPTWRCTSVVGLNFFAVNTGFGLLLGAITPVVLSVFAARAGLARRDRAIYVAAVGASLATLAHFFYGFTFVSAADCFVFPSRHPWEYVPFAGFVLARPFGAYAGATTAALVLGSAVVLAAAGVWTYAAARFVGRREPAQLWAATTTLVGFTLLFAVASAVGRLCVGLPSADATRYVPYVTPGLLGLYLVVRGAPRRPLRRVLLWLLVAASFYKEVAPSLSVTEAETFSSRKQRWRDCYLRRHDIEVCDSEAGSLYPRPTVTRLKEKLDWLEARGYNLFQDGPTGTDRP